MHELSTHKQAAQASMSFTSACSAYQGSYVYKYIEHYAGMTCLNHMCPHITCPAVICFKACVSHYRDKDQRPSCLFFTASFISNSSYITHEIATFAEYRNPIGMFGFSSARASV